MPVIVATQEAEVRKISVQSQLHRNSWQDPIVAGRRSRRKQTRPEF
jgi:hypothetical protein